MYSSLMAQGPNGPGIIEKSSVVLPISTILAIPEKRWMTRYGHSVRSINAAWNDQPSGCLIKNRNPWVQTSKTQIEVIDLRIVIATIVRDSSLNRTKHLRVRGRSPSVHKA